MQSFLFFFSANEPKTQFSFKCIRNLAFKTCLLQNGEEEMIVRHKYTHNIYLYIYCYCCFLQQPFIKTASGSLKREDIIFVLSSVIRCNFFFLTFSSDITSWVWNEPSGSHAITPYVGQHIRSAQLTDLVVTFCIGERVKWLKKISIYFQVKKIIALAKVFTCVRGIFHSLLLSPSFCSAVELYAITVSKCVFPCFY